ncbi:MAG TPA: hypothetical protein VFQ39_04790, partial [Longimicrobium sp.]|nr:hypothetical protein [Longimicrobium sp.]
EARFAEGTQPDVQVTVDAAAAHLLGRAQLTAEQVGWLDQQGNANGRYDVGDFRAWLRSARPPVSAEMRPLVERLAPGAVPKR